MPLIISVSMGFVAPGLSLTAVGNPAPPMPAMPASRMRSTNSEGAIVCHSGMPSHRIDSSAPSVSRTMQVSSSPDACAMGRDSMALIVPEVGACTGTLMTPCAWASTCPPSTASPTSTMALAGTPKCCRSGNTKRAGRVASRSSPGRDSVFRSGGWIPP